MSHGSGTPRSRRALRRAALAAAGVLLLGLAACSGAEDTAQSTGGEAAVGGDVAEAPAAEGGGAADGPGGAVEDAGGDDAGLGQGGEALPPAPPASPGDRIIKEGTIHLEVPSGEFDRAYSAVVAEARRLGGDVLASTTGTQDDSTYGSITVRVPVSAFEDLLVGVAGIGEVRGRDVRAQDVSTEFVDLESRLRHLQAQERFYLGLLDEAETVSDAIAVQQQLDGVQGQIEQARGRLQVLEDRTSFSRLTVELSEPGAPGGSPRPFGETRDLLRWWEAGLDAFVTMLGALLVAVLFALPLLVLAVPVTLLVLRARRRRRDERTEAGGPPSTEREQERVGV